MEHSEELDKIIIKADSLLSGHSEAEGFIGVVKEGGYQNNAPRGGNERLSANGEQMSMNQGNRRVDDRVCWNCGLVGHVRRFCSGVRQNLNGQIREPSMQMPNQRGSGGGIAYQSAPPQFRPQFRANGNTRENFENPGNLRSVPQVAPVPSPYNVPPPNMGARQENNQSPTVPLNSQTPLL